MANPDVASPHLTNKVHNKETNEQMPGRNVGSRSDFNLEILAKKPIPRILSNTVVRCYSNLDEAMHEGVVSLNNWHVFSDSHQIFYTKQFHLFYKEEEERF